MKVHPSEVLREYRETYSGTQKELAEAMSVTPKTVSLLLNSKARITVRIAKALESVFHRPAHFWLNLQANYDLSEVVGEGYEKTISYKKVIQKLG